MNHSHHLNNSDQKTDALRETQFLARTQRVVAKLKPSPRTLNQILEHTFVTTVPEARLTGEDIAQGTASSPLSSLFAMLSISKPLAFAVFGAVLVLGAAVVMFPDRSSRAPIPVASSDPETSTFREMPTGVTSDGADSADTPGTDAASPTRPVDSNAASATIALITDDLDSFDNDDGYDDSLLSEDEVDSLLITLDSDVDENSL